MTAIRIDGNVLATKVRERIATDVSALKARGITPGLAVVLVGDDPASQVYVRNKAVACAKVGIHSVIHRLPAETSERELLSCIHTLNNDATIHGILVQLPLPKQIAEKKVLEAVAASGSGDWRTYSALGSAYDQQGLYDKAQAEYSKALALQPDELSVVNNMGMSYALQGNLKQAETTLRQASLSPKAGSQPRIRQNLALIVGLQGRFEEARKIASEDLPPDQVEANMDYLQKMLSQPNTWQQLAKGGEG